MAEVALAVPLIYGAAAALQGGLAIASFLSKERPAGLHRGSHYTYDTFQRISSNLSAVQRVIDRFSEYANMCDSSLLSQDGVKQKLDHFVQDVKQVLSLLHSQLSTTDNHKLAKAFQGLRLLINLRDVAEYAPFWAVVDRVAIGDMANLISEFVNRHPANFAETTTDSTQSRALALSSVHTGLFIGMNDWKRVLGGGLPGRMSNNSCFQLSAKSPIRLVKLPTETHAASTTSNNASRLVRADSDEMMDKSKATTNQKAAKDNLQRAVHGQMVQIQVEGDHYLYQPSVAGMNAVFCPEIGKYFRQGTKDIKLQWKMEHIVHDMSLNLAAKMVQLPFVCGDRVAFYNRAICSKEDVSGENGWLPLTCSRGSLQKSYHYGLLRHKRWSEECVFCLWDQEEAASWEWGSIPAHV